MTSMEQVWLAAWRRAGPAMDRLRREALRGLDHREVIAAFDDAFVGVLRDTPPRTTSGLVEQQRHFARLRRMP